MLENLNIERSSKGSLHWWVFLRTSIVRQYAVVGRWIRGLQRLSQVANTDGLFPDGILIIPIRKTINIRRRSIHCLSSSSPIGVIWTVEAWTWRPTWIGLNDFIILFFFVLTVVLQWGHRVKKGLFPA